MSDPHPQFEDPALKAALKRAAGGETAPAHLRSRVLGAIDSARRAGATKSAVTSAIKRDWRNNPLVGLAAAAMLVIAIGLIYNHVREQQDHVFAGVTLPTNLTRMMVVNADAGADALDANLLAGVSSPELPILAASLKQQLNHPVMVASLGDDWKLTAAGVSHFGDVPAAQLVFTNGQRKVSLFSFAGAKFYTTKEGLSYEQAEGKHAIAGFVQGGIVHCLVGDEEMSLKQMAKLRDKVRSTVKISASHDGCGAPDEHRAGARV